MATARSQPDLLLGRFDSSLHEGDGEFVELRLAGEVDRAEAVALRRSLERAAGRERHVLLDLRACCFLDSSALAAMLLACRAVEERGRRLRCYGGGEQVRRIFEVSGLAGKLFWPARKDALRDLLED